MPPLSSGRGVLADGIGDLGSDFAGVLAALPAGFGLRLAARYAFSVLTLHPEQRDAVAGLIGSRDRWNALIGDAGTGKTFAASELVRAYIEAGRDVFMCAPSNSARDVLRADGRRLREERRTTTAAEPFERAESLQKLLCDKQLQQSIGSDGLVFVDEAGLASTKMLHELMELADKHRWRVHLQGDDKQHTSVEAGDAFRLLLAHSSMRRWHLSDIRRQTAESGLREVSRHFAAGRVGTGLELLEARGSIIEAQGEQRLRHIARDYVEVTQGGKSCLVVNRTHRENDAVSGFIRDELKSRGLLGESHAVDTVRSLGWTAAQKRDYRNYAPGQVIEVTTGRERGKTFEVKGVERGMGVRVCDHEGRERYFSRGDSNRIDVCEKRSLEIAVGDLILLRSGQKNQRGELVNGERLQITRVEESGIYGRSLGPDGQPKQTEIPITIRNFAHGYASTSHRSQGNTVQVALVGLDRESITRADNKMLYVASTREREGLRYYVESKAALFAHAGNVSGHRKAALDLAHKPGGRRDIQRVLKCKQAITVPFLYQIGLKFMRGFTQLTRFVTQTVQKREATIIAASRKIDPECQQEIARPVQQTQGHGQFKRTQSRSQGYSP
jgi:ATP-dependent exoDNAse (exonuclease V) alpha subunit